MFLSIVLIVAAFRPGPIKPIPPLLCISRLIEQRIALFYFPHTVRPARGEIYLYPPEHHSSFLPNHQNLGYNSRAVLSFGHTGGSWLRYVAEILGGIPPALSWIGNNLRFFPRAAFPRYAWETKVTPDRVEGKGNLFICAMECLGSAWHASFGSRPDVVVKHEVN